MRSADHLKKLHPMHSFGVVSGLTKQIRVTRLESRLDPAVPFPHKHSFFHVVIITEGKGWHEIDFKRYTVAAGNIFFMKPVQVHSWAMSAKTCGYVIEFEDASMFTGDPAFKLLSGLLKKLPDWLSANPSERKTIFSLCDLMITDYEGAKADFEVSLRLNLSVLLLLFSRIEKTSAVVTSDNPDFTEKYLALIEKNYHIHHNVQFYADALKITAKALTMRISRTTGKAARDLIQERCLLESKRLLAYSDLSVSEIAEELGFIDPNYFTRFFKLHTALNPGQFRKNVRSLC